MKNRRMVKIARVAFVLAAIGWAANCFAALPTTNTYWNAVGGDYNGSFDDAAHWTANYQPGLPFLLAWIDRDADYTVTFPSGRTETPDAFWIYAKPNRVVTLTGPDSVWIAPDYSESAYPQRDAMKLYANSKLLFSQAFCCGTDGKLGWGTISNFTLRVSATNDAYRVDFAAGTFDFGHVGDRALSCAQSIYNDATLDKPSYVTVGPGAAWIGYTMYFQLCAPTNALCVDGGSFTLGSSMQMPVATWEFCSTKPTLGLLDVRNGGSFKVDGLYMGANYKNKDGVVFVSDLKTMAVAVTGGSSYESRNLSMQGPGLMTFGVTGSTFRVTNTSSFAGTVGSTNVFRACDADVYLKSLTLGAAAVGANSYASLSFDASTLDLPNGATIYNGEMNFGEGSVVTISASSEIKGGSSVGGHSKLTFDGATLVPTVANTYSGHLQGLDEVQLGAKGLTVAPLNNVYTTLKANFSNKAGEEGRLILPCGASYKLNGTGMSTESELVIGGLNAGVYLCDGDHYSKVIVTNGASFSLSYLPAGRLTAEVKGLQLGNAETIGRLGLNVNQTLISDTEPQFGQYQIAYPGNALVAGVYTTIVAKVSSVSDAARIAWEDGLQFQNGTVSGRYYVGKVVETADRTYFTFHSLAARPTREGTTAWQGASGASWAEPTNWADGKLPSETYGAVFAPESDLTVNLGSVTVASIDFNGADTTLTGERIQLADTAGVELNATAGDHTIDADMRLPKGQTPAAIAADASVEVKGDVIGSGGIRKTGAGKLVLSGDSTALPSGFSHEGGILQIDDAAALATIRTEATAMVWADTLCLGWKDAAPVTTTKALTFRNNSGVSGKGVVLRVDSDVTMPRPVDNSDVSVLKRGPGTLTWNFTGANAAMGFVLYNTKEIGNPTSGIVEPVVFDDETGATPLCRYGTWNVCEGEMCWRGLDATPTVINPNNVGVAGLATATASSEPFVQPTFRLDNVQIDNKNLWFMFAAGLKADDGGLVTDPKLILTNNAAVRAVTLAFGDKSTNPAAHPFFFVDGSELYAKTIFYLNRGVTGSTSGMLLTGVLTNGASCLTPTMPLQNPSELTFFGSTFAGIDGGYVRMYQDNDGARTNSFAFLDGSRFACTNICYVATAYAANAVVKLDFDDSAWDAGDRNIDLTIQQVKALVGTTGKGLAFAPPAGRTWRFATPVSGTGDVVKRGAGTLAFDTYEHYDNNTKKIEKQADAVTMNWTGTTRIEAGTLVFPPEACRSGMAFDLGADGTLDLGQRDHSGYVLSGTGTVADGTLSGCTLALSVVDGAVPAAPCFDNVTFAGRTVVDFGRTAENPLADPTEGLVVARWTGKRPVVSRWRARGTGYERNFKGFFTVNDDGTVSARLQSVGMALIVR